MDSSFPKRALTVLGLCAIPSLFVAGITLNFAPSLIELVPGICPPGTHVVSGHRAIPGSRSGTEGFARCEDASGQTRDDVFGKAFFMFFGGLTLAGASIVGLRSVGSKTGA